MRKINFSLLPWEEQKSPAGKFHSFHRNVSLALGGQRNTGLTHGGHPFDVQFRRVPSGASICPFHLHLQQWELFTIESGVGTVRAGDHSFLVKPGDVFIHPPGEPHQLTNTGASELVVMIVADNPPLDGFYYPDSGKWGLRPPGEYFRVQSVNYFDGEETSPEVALKKIPPPLAAPAVLMPGPFHERKLHSDDLPWVPWTSPKNKFRGTSKELSIALGAKRKTPTGLGGHPFDLELSKLAPGDCGCPYHSHATQWELFIILSGTASVRTPDETFLAGAGEAILFHPGDAHQLTNGGGDDLIFFLITDNPAVDIFHYPDSNKWGFSSPNKYFRMEEIDYWDDEE